jgi:hypothetical protein
MRIMTAPLDHCTRPSSASDGSCKLVDRSLLLGELKFPVHEFH